MNTSSDSIFYNKLSPEEMWDSVDIGDQPMMLEDYSDYGDCQQSSTDFETCRDSDDKLQQRPTYTGHNKPIKRIESILCEKYLNPSGINIGDEEANNTETGSKGITPHRSTSLPFPIRPNVLLTLDILERIRNSISMFAPSRSLKELIDAYDFKGRRPGMACKSLVNLLDLEAQYNRKQNNLDSSMPISHASHGSNSLEQNQDSLPPAAEIDLVISGGGLKAFFACGAADVLKHALYTHNIRIARLAGASAGAWAGNVISNMI